MTCQIKKITFFRYLGIDFIWNLWKWIGIERAKGNNVDCAEDA